MMAVAGVIMAAAAGGLRRAFAVTCVVARVFGLGHLILRILKHIPYGGI
jgi:hypothetical protein